LLFVSRLHFRCHDLRDGGHCGVSLFGPMVEARWDVGRSCEVDGMVFAARQIKGSLSWELEVSVVRWLPRCANGERLR
jgi:hypothetical protein